MQGYNRLAFADVIIRQDVLADELARIENDMGLPNIPLAQMGSDQCFSLIDIYDAEMDSLSRDVYARDYVMYGFENWG